MTLDASWTDVQFGASGVLQACRMVRAICANVRTSKGLISSSLPVAVGTGDTIAGKSSGLAGAGPRKRCKTSRKQSKNRSDKVADAVEGCLDMATQRSTLEKRRLPPEG
eukprot:CAMPEP_0180820134 /NCGR_PEP_ID=MMETSP1038_2-20121128/70117_1 /TAXON_ID=632150 /ORGANISM="Azadinium spinosum, Strain 3D9" /LENGTH=108 /DNA_ID=CAMNT_0022862193 /DNA_START=220 /DNA_END=543 /DNA_ORIENTATION=-